MEILLSNLVLWYIATWTLCGCIWLFVYAAKTEMAAYVAVTNIIGCVHLYYQVPGTSTIINIRSVTIILLLCYNEDQDLVQVPFFFS